jgi:seryl-tRNA synthetase
MLDLNDFIITRGGDPERIRESQRRRGALVDVVDQVIALFEEHQSAQYAVRQTGCAINKVQGDIVKRKEESKDATEVFQRKRTLEATKNHQEAIAKEKHAEPLALAKAAGNYVDDSVPVHQDESHNPIIRIWDDVNKLRKAALSHHEILLRFDGYDPVRGVKLVEHRGYILTGYGVFLNQALVNYGLEFLFLKGKISSFSSSPSSC